MRDYLLLAFVLGAVPFMLARPQIGILFWSWISYMNPHRYTWGLAYSAPLAQVIAGATILGLLFSKEKKRIPWSGLTVTWLVFILWMCVTTLFALVPDDAHEAWIRAMKIQIMSFVTLAVITTPERIKALVWVIVLSIGFFGVKGGLFTIATGGEFMIFGPPESFITGNNEVSLALVMIIPLMRFLQLNSTNRYVRLGLLGAMMLSAMAVLGSYSRGAFLAISAMVVSMIMKTRHRALLIMLALIAAPMMWTFMPEEYHERLGTIRTYQTDESAVGRINAWWFAWNVAKERPIVGGGFDVFDPDLFKKYAPNPLDFHDAHSIYFQVLGEQGFVGLGLFLLTGWMTLKQCGRILRDTDGRADSRWAYDLAAMCQVSLIGYAVGGAFLGLAYWDLPYQLIALMVVTGVLVRQEIADADNATKSADTPTEGRDLAAEARG